jgi:ankyrin repeat protein
MAAAEGGHVSVAKLLLECGADVQAADNNGATALMWASAGGHMAVAELLKVHAAGRIRSLWRWLFR